MMSKTHGGKYILLATLFSITVGLLHSTFVASAHKAILPEYYFFISIGFVQIIWAIWFFTKKKDIVYHLGSVLNGGLVVLWILTRIFNAPLVNQPEHVDLLGVVVTVLELLSVVLSAMWHSFQKHESKFFTVFGTTVLVALFAGISFLFLGYGVNAMFPEYEVEGHGHEGENDVHREDDKDMRGEGHMDSGEIETHEDVLIIDNEHINKDTNKEEVDDYEARDEEHHKKSDGHR